MNKLMLSAVAVFFSATTLRAFPILDGQVKEKPVVAGECTDFSGKFHGACVVEGTRAEESFEIKQSGCDVLSMGGHKFHIGGLVTVTQSIPAMGKEMAKAETMALSTQWDQKKESLLFQGGKMKQKLSATETGAAPMKMVGKASLVDKKLTLQFNELSEAGSKAFASCVYVKQ